ncbi:leucine-rich repeat-containing protein 42-like [Saccostrea echinata]|uniref:leucine-rich repeat-containing protein 42-like n=1 Tax=Saccostrea echinata TaxID=191078 RepID=UPI002A83945E|nr:leucine-rich repeat-containing protein 42-like [Saccostrea echinata]
MDTRPLKLRKTEEQIPQGKQLKVPALYNQCIRYIAKNLHMVESFSGFPDLVASDIFKEAEKLRKFDIVASEIPSKNDSLKNIQLFCEVYSDCVLSSLNLSTCYLGLNYCLEHFLTFYGLHSLDVSNCFLGDDHEILSHIASLLCLKELNLRKNCLSDKGVCNLYAPFMLFKRGPEHLTVLDISENGCVSKKSVQKLKCFTHLQKIDVTGTSVKVKEMSNEWRLYPEKTDSLLSIINEGWASELVQKWTVQAIQAQNSNNQEKKTSKFYSLLKKKSQVAVKDASVVSFVPGYRLILYRNRTKNPVPAQQSKVHTNTEQDTCASMNSIIDLYKVKDDPR